MGDVINLEKYREAALIREIEELKKELEIVMSTWPEHLGSAYYLSLEEMERIEQIWVEEKRTK